MSEALIVRFIRGDLKDWRGGLKDWLAAVCAWVTVMVATCLPAFAACTLSGANATTISGGTSTVVTPAYNPTAPGDQLHNFTVTLSNPNTAGNGSCTVGLSFTRSSLPATMTNGTSNLQYSIESTGGATLLQTTGFAFFSSPPNANRIGVTLAPGANVSITVRIRIPAGQTSATSGVYSDNTVTVGIYELFFGFLPIAVVDERTFTVGASIVGSCVLPAPDVSTLNFTPAITSGVPNPGFVLTSTFSGVSCTAPSRIRLTGFQMNPSPATGAVAGLDNFIDYRAVAQFGAANATLRTDLASQVTSLNTNVVSGAVTGASITVDVNLIAAQPIIAGTYSAILTVTIDPSL